MLCVEIFFLVMYNLNAAEVDANNANTYLSASLKERRM